MLNLQSSLTGAREDIRDAEASARDHYARFAPVVDKVCILLSAAFVATHPGTDHVECDAGLAELREAIASVDLSAVIAAAERLNACTDFWHQTLPLIEDEGGGESQ